ncbi:hypothetical protein HRS9139_08733 [Pyrenophora teres f. teres]|uniref:Uncharacterized protein n=1 Tax=Pyrenophora teres f. teres TaxID=97479 RepID=A0A6S6W8J5_9PLEO|nr:hypothetical protein HRS9139_08733 [Pyrenophora teres f. teres]CAE7194433.1 hypothetical protein PTTW11_07950 [Pyrenophora teres f. teres]
MVQATNPALRHKMQAHADTLAILESGTQEGLDSFIDTVIVSYGGHQDEAVVDIRPQSVQHTERSSILEDITDILNLRGRLQQMGATFDPSGELLTYGNPELPSEFNSMLKLGPLYPEQWNTFFVSDYMPAAGGDMWSELRTLKKMLNNEGVVFGQEDQRYSFGDFSAKLRRLCFAYDTLWVEWRNTMRTALPAQQVNDELDDIVDKASQVHDSRFVDDSVQGGVEITASPNIIQQRHHPLSRGDGTPHNIGWRFSAEISQSSICDQWRFSNDLELAPVSNCVERATVLHQTVRATTNTQPVIEELMILQTSLIQQIKSNPVIIVASRTEHAPVTSALDLQSVRSLGPQTGDAQAIIGTAAPSISTSFVTDEQEDQHEKKYGKLWRRFRRALIWK